jgi:hypothetical protein
MEFKNILNVMNNKKQSFASSVHDNNETPINQPVDECLLVDKDPETGDHEILSKPLDTIIEEQSTITPSMRPSEEMSIFSSPK